MFPLSFQLALSLLRKGQLSSNMFLVSCVTPYWSVYVYVKRSRSGHVLGCVREGEEEFKNEILEIDEDVLKPSDTFFSWNAMMLYRKVSIVLIKIFVIDPVESSG